MQEKEWTHKDQKVLGTLGDRERSSRDIEKLEQILIYCKSLKLSSEYDAAVAWAENYYTDAKHFYEKKDYFSAFGAANYAYGIIDALLIIEGKKDNEK